MLGTGADELEDFAVAVGGLAVLAACLVDHAQTIVAVMHLGKARDEIASGVLGFIELAGVDQVDEVVDDASEVDGWSSGAVDLAERVAVVLVLRVLVVIFRRDPG